jgi:hypothetical protein
MFAWSNHQAYAGTPLDRKVFITMTRIEFEAEESWSVEYDGVAYDDARKIDGTWYYRHPATRAIRRFAFQDQVVPLRKNQTTEAPGIYQV